MLILRLINLLFGQLNQYSIGKRCLLSLINFQLGIEIIVSNEIFEVKLDSIFVSFLDILKTT